MQRIVKEGNKFILQTAIAGTKANWQNNAIWVMAGRFSTMQEAKDASYMYLV